MYALLCGDCLVDMVSLFDGVVGVAVMIVHGWSFINFHY